MKPHCTSLRTIIVQVKKWLRRSLKPTSDSLQHDLNPNYVSDGLNRLKKSLNGYLILIIKQEWTIRQTRGHRGLEVKRVGTLETRGMRDNDNYHTCFWINSCQRWLAHLSRTLQHNRRDLIFEIPPEGKWRRKNPVKKKMMINETIHYQEVSFSPCFVSCKKFQQNCVVRVERRRDLVRHTISFAVSFSGSSRLREHFVFFSSRVSPVPERWLNVQQLKVGVKFHFFWSFSAEAAA